MDRLTIVSTFTVGLLITTFSYTMEEELPEAKQYISNNCHEDLSDLIVGKRWPTVLKTNRKEIQKESDKSENSMTLVSGLSSQKKLRILRLEERPLTSPNINQRSDPLDYTEK